MIPRPAVSSAVPWRFRIVMLLLSLVAIGLMVRMVQLTLIDRPFLLRQGNARTLRTVPIPAIRGMIVDRQGYPLAITTPVKSIWVNPQHFAAKESQLVAIARITGDSVASLRRRLQQSHHKSFVYLKRHLSPQQAKEIAALKLPGLHFLQEYRRYYPEGAVFAQVLGFTNIDDQGQEGLELEYNAWLKGQSGKEKVLKDRLGRVIAVEGILQSAKPGKTLQLSLDHRIQFLAYHALKKAVTANKAESGSVVVLDVNSGEVLAMANYPSYNPNVRPKHSGSRYRNRAMTDMFEPGSTIKAFSVANALSSGRYKPTSIIDTSPGWMILDGNRVRDHHNNGKIDVTTILQRSSNMGVTKLTLSLPPDSLWQLLHGLGFGQRTQTGFPGEVSGILRHHRQWSPFTLATLSFGYGLSTTTVQLAHAYSVLGAGGMSYPVTLLKQQQSPLGQRIITNPIAEELLAMLESVVEKGGTATRGNIPGYHVSGKTGTVRIVGPNGYEKNHHMAMFVGIAPSTHPRLVVAVNIKDPKAGKFYGGLVAAPVFKRIMGGALRTLDVPPDNLYS